MPFVRAVALALLLTVVASADEGVLDVEVENRTCVVGSLRRPAELETVRLRVPGGAALTVDVRGSRRTGALAVRVFDEAGDEIDAGAYTSTARGTRVDALPVNATALYRVDVRGDGVRTGAYRARLFWAEPRDVVLDETIDVAPVHVAVLASERSRVRVRLAAPGTRLLGVTGPEGFALPFPDGAPRRALRGVRLGPAGTYLFTFGADAPTTLTGSLRVTAPTRCRRVNLTTAGRRIADGRVVGRRLDPDGGVVLVPTLGDGQTVGTDISGASLDVPPGALSTPAAFELRAGAGFDDPDGTTTPAGVPVEVVAEDSELDEDATVVLPFDAGAFPLGFDTVCVFRRDDRGRVTKVPGPYSIDAVAGTVSFPASRFSSFNAFRPALELAVVARPRVPVDLAVAADGSIFVAELKTVSRFTPPDGPLELFAGGGTNAFGDDVARLDYAFNLVEEVEVTSAGEVLIAETIFDDPEDTARVSRVTAAGRLLRVAGEGRTEVADDVPALEARLPPLRALGVDVDDNFYVLDARPDDADLFRSRRLLRVDATTGLLTVLAGDTTYVPTPDDMSRFPDVEGLAPLDAFISIGSSLLVDSQGRVLVGDSGAVLRFDLAQNVTEIVAGTDRSEGFRARGRRDVSGVGAPLRSVRFGRIDGLAFDPASEDFLYVADDFAGLVWRLDLVRNRAYLIAGKRRRFLDNIARIRVPAGAREPFTRLGGPAAVVLAAGRVYIAETFSDTLRVLRPK